MHGRMYVSARRQEVLPALLKRLNLPQKRSNATIAAKNPVMMLPVRLVKDVEGAKALVGPVQHVVAEVRSSIFQNWEALERHAWGSAGSAAAAEAFILHEIDAAFAMGAAGDPRIVPTLLKESIRDVTGSQKQGHRRRNLSV